MQDLPVEPTEEQLPSAPQSEPQTQEQPIENGHSGLSSEVAENVSIENKTETNSIHEQSQISSSPQDPPEQPETVPEQSQALPSQSQLSAQSQTVVEEKQYELVAADVRFENNEAELKSIFDFWCNFD